MSLYHYTTLNGLLGIVENNSIWATNIYYLNDKNEFEHGRECLIKTLDCIEPTFMNENDKKLFLKELEHFSDGGSVNVFSASFCRTGDKLSQWRGYGGEQGICIEFDEDNLFDWVDPEYYNFRKGEVVYLKPGKTIKDHQLIVENLLNNSINALLNEDDLFKIVHYEYVIPTIIPFCKDESFHEEDEFRYIFIPADEECIKFRASDKGLIPYIELQTGKGSNLPIKKIIVGPGKYSEDVIKSLKYFLRHYNYHDVIVDGSKIPYRG